MTIYDFSRCVLISSHELYLSLGVTGLSHFSTRNYLPAFRLVYVLTLLPRVKLGTAE